MKNDRKTDPNSSGTMTVSFFGSFPQITEQDASIPSSGQRFCTQPTYAQSRSSQRWPFTRGRCCQSTSGTSSGTSRFFSAGDWFYRLGACLAQIWVIRPSVIQVKRLFLPFSLKGKGVRLKEKAAERRANCLRWNGKI